MATQKKRQFLGLIVGMVGVFLVGAVALSVTLKRAVPPDESSELVWVMKPDGAKSCAPDSGLPVDQALEELKAAHISVRDSRKGSDGKMHAQVCGAPQGSTHSFLIDRKDLGGAIALGYSVEKP